MPKRLTEEEKVARAAAKEAKRIALEERRKKADERRKEREAKAAERKDARELKEAAWRDAKLARCDELRRRLEAGIAPKHAPICDLWLPSGNVEVDDGFPSGEQGTRDFASQHQEGLTRFSPPVPLERIRRGVQKVIVRRSIRDERMTADEGFMLDTGLVLVNGSSPNEWHLLHPLSGAAVCSSRTWEAALKVGRSVTADALSGWLYSREYSVKRKLGPKLADIGRYPSGNLDLELEAEARSIRESMAA